MPYVPRVSPGWLTCSLAPLAICVSFPPLVNPELFLTNYPQNLTSNQNFVLVIIVHFWENIFSLLLYSTNMEIFLEKSGSNRGKFCFKNGNLRRSGEFNHGGASWGRYIKRSFVATSLPPLYQTFTQGVIPMGGYFLCLHTLWLDFGLNLNVLLSQAHALEALFTRNKTVFIRNGVITKKRPTYSAGKLKKVRISQDALS